MNRFKNALLAACSLGLATLSLLALGQTVPAYTFVDLGTVDNQYTTATGINDAGQITGFFFDGTNNHAYRITPVVSNGVLTWFQGSGNLNSLMSLVTTDSKHPYSESWGINAQGELAGQALGSGYTLPQNAFFWRAADLSGVQVSSTKSWSWAINNNSSVVGEIFPNRGAPLVTIWRLVNGSFVATTIPTPSGYTAGNPTGVNNLDQAVGANNDSSSNPQPYLWLPAAAYGLPAGTNLLPSMTRGGYPGGVNDAGTIVGYGLTTTAPYYQAVMWSPGLTGYTLSMLGSAVFPSSSASAINNLGQVVGMAEDTIFEDRAFVWDSTNGMRDLNVLTVNAPQGGVTVAAGVNTGGLIVGTYQYGNLGPIRAFVLVPNTTLPADTSAPASPSSVSASGVTGANQIALGWAWAWAAGSAGENGFQICRTRSGINAWKQIGWVDAGVTSFTDTFEDNSYTPATNYTYMVSAFNGTGYSAGATVSFVTPGAPAAPTSVVASPNTGPIRIILSWANNSNTQDYLSIERSNDGVSFAALATVTPGTTTRYTDTAVAGAKTYYYRLRANSTNGSLSAYSAVVSATTPRK